MASFKSAFAAARKAGKKEFTWNGKAYNTKLKEDNLPKKAPIPSPRPKPKVGAFRGIDSDDFPMPKRAMPKTGRDRFGPAPKAKAAPKAGKSGATQGFGLGEAKQSAAFKKSNERASEYQKKLPSKIGKSLRKDY